MVSRGAVAGGIPQSVWLREEFAQTFRLLSGLLQPRWPILEPQVGGFGGFQHLRVIR
jgi:hypothetical protein